MDLSIKFKNKLLLVVVIVVLGIASLAAVSLIGMFKLERALVYVSNVGQVTNNLSQLQLSVIRAESRINYIRPAEAEIYRQDLEALYKEFSQSIINNIDLLEDPQATGFLEQDLKDFGDYFKSINESLELTIKIGLDNKSGFLAALNQHAKALEDEFEGISSLNEAFIKIRQIEKEFLLSPDNKKQQQLELATDKLLEKLITFGFEDKFGQGLSDYRQSMESLMVSLLYGKEVQQRVVDSRKRFGRSTEEAVDYVQQALLIQARMQADESVEQARFATIFGSLILAIVMGVLFCWIGLGVRQSLKKIIDHLLQVGKGDLTRELPVCADRNDEFDQVSESVNKMTAELHKVIFSLASSSHQLSGMAEESSKSVGSVVNGNQSIDKKNSSLVAAIGQICVTSDDMVGTTANLRQLSTDVHTKTSEGQSTINSAMSLLQETAVLYEEAASHIEQLEKRSKEIDSIIDIITSLAQQTNLLALNAAIEAARAGDAGRGFSVVADEVRTLAERTVEETSEIAKTIKAIQRQVKETTLVMEQGCTTIKAAGQESRGAQEAINTIERKALEASSVTDTISSTIDDIARTIKVMSLDMENIALDMGDNNKSIELILLSSNKVNDQAISLENITKNFKIAHKKNAEG